MKSKTPSDEDDSVGRPDRRRRQRIPKDEQDEWQEWRAERARRGRKPPSKHRVNRRREPEPDE